MKLFCFCIFMLVGSAANAGNQTLTVKHVETPPAVDGSAEDAAWLTAEWLTVHDSIAGIDIRLKGVYSAGSVYFLVSFPDQDESRMHKCWVWDAGKKYYGLGNMREDVFLFKWNMENRPVDLSIYADAPYRADIWYWKALRTDPMGYADDKMHVFSSMPMPDSTEIINKKGRKMYLFRKEDSGRSAYSVNLQVDYAGDMLNRYEGRIPQGSRGDVRAKGIWADGAWTIEFARALDTGSDDDLQFDPGRRYLFGVSRYEIAGRGANSKLTQPLYGAGDVGDLIELIFEAIPK